jgi:putative component of toxin-antitoxin plasmid stabilization module
VVELCVSYGIRWDMRVFMPELCAGRIKSLRDRIGRARIQVRVDRLAHGNSGSTGR